MTETASPPESHAAPPPTGPLARLLRTITRSAAIIAMIGLFIIAVVTVIDVLLRWIFNAPMHGATDIAGTAIMLVAAACFVSGANYQEHISIHLLGILFGKRVGRFFDILGSVVLAAFIVGIAYHLWGHSNEMVEENRQMSVLSWPMAPWWYGATILMWLCAAAHILDIFVPQQKHEPEDAADMA